MTILTTRCLYLSQLVVLSDEIYERLTYADPHVSFASLPDMMVQHSTARPTSTICVIPCWCISCNRNRGIVQRHSYAYISLSLSLSLPLSSFLSLSFVSTHDFRSMPNDSWYLHLSLSSFLLSHDFDQERTVVVNGFSKSHSMTGKWPCCD